MTVDTNTRVSSTETNPKVTNLGIELSKAEQDMFLSNEELLSISQRLIDQNKEAYEVLAK